MTPKKFTGSPAATSAPQLLWSMMAAVPMARMTLHFIFFAVV